MFSVDVFFCLSTLRSNKIYKKYNKINDKKNNRGGKQIDEISPSTCSAAFLSLPQRRVMFVIILLKTRGTRAKFGLYGAPDALRQVTSELLASGEHSSTAVVP